MYCKVTDNRCGLGLVLECIPTDTTLDVDEVKID